MKQQAAPQQHEDVPSPAACIGAELGMIIQRLLNHHKPLGFCHLYIRLDKLMEYLSPRAWRRYKYAAEASASSSPQNLMKTALAEVKTTSFFNMLLESHTIEGFSEGAWIFDAILWLTVLWVPVRWYYPSFTTVTVAM
jgi:hypothetical protein